MKALDEETLELMSSSSLTNASPSSNNFSPESPAAASSRAASYLSREVASELVDGCKRVLSHPRDGFFQHNQITDFPVYSLHGGPSSRGQPIIDTAYKIAL